MVNQIVQSAGMKPYAEACERNQRPVLEGFKIELTESVDGLEIGSRTGQHTVYFGARFLVNIDE